MIQEIQKKKIQKVRRLSRIVAVVAVVVIGVLYFVFGYRLGDLGNLINKLGVEKSVEQGISSDDAVKLAQQRVQTDGVMSLDGRSTVVKEEQDYWHISFPISSPKVFGGEPHVLIDKASGAITRVYYTQ